MISVIISTYNQTYFESVSKNIHETIGVEYEIIGIENYAQYSLCKAYNMGVDQAKYPYLCFVHEDIIFHTNKWGSRLISNMEMDSSIGLIGVVGTKFKSTYPNTGWGNGAFLKRFTRGHVYLDNKLENHLEFDVRTKKNEIEDVVIVDGIFLFTKNDVMKKCRFDDNTLNHFHAYDTDFSLQVFFQSYRVIVDRGIILVHFSPGIFAADFANENKKIVNKWKKKLPVASNDLNFNRLQLLFYDSLCWYGYLKNMIIRKINYIKSQYK